MTNFLNQLAIFLEREAGYHTIGFVLIILGVIIMAPDQRSGLGRDMVMMALGWIGRSMNRRTDKVIGDKVVGEKNVVQQ